MDLPERVTGNDIITTDEEMDLPEQFTGNDLITTGTDEEMDETIASPQKEMDDEDYFLKFRVKGTFIDFTENYKPKVSLPPRPSTAGPRSSGNKSLVKIDIFKNAQGKKVGPRNGRVGPTTSYHEELVLEGKLMEKLRALLVAEKPFILASSVINDHIENKGVITSRIFAILMRFVVSDDHPELLRDWVNHYYTQVESCNIHTKSSLLRALASMKSWELCLKKILELHSGEGRKHDDKFKEVLYQAAFETCIRHDCPEYYRKQVTKCIKEANVTIQTPKDVKFLDNLKFMKNIVTPPVYEHRTRDRYEHVRNFWRLTKVLEPDDYRGASSSSSSMNTNNRSLPSSSALRNRTSTSTRVHTGGKAATGKGHGRQANNANTMRRQSVASQSTCTSLQSSVPRPGKGGRKPWTTTNHHARRNPGAQRSSTLPTPTLPTPSHPSTMMEQYHAYMQSHAHVATPHAVHEATHTQQHGVYQNHGTSSRDDEHLGYNRNVSEIGRVMNWATPHGRPTCFSADMTTSIDPSTRGQGQSYTSTHPAPPRSNYGSFLRGSNLGANNTTPVLQLQETIVIGQEAYGGPRSMVRPETTNKGAANESHTTVPQPGPSGAPPKENHNPKSRRLRRRAAREREGRADAVVIGGGPCTNGLTDVSGRQDHQGSANDTIIQPNNASTGSKRTMEGKNMEEGGEKNTDGPKQQIPGNENQHKDTQNQYAHARKFYPLTVCSTSAPANVSTVGFESSSSTAKTARCDHTEKEAEKAKGEGGTKLEVTSSENKGQDKGDKGKPSSRAYDLREKVDWAMATDNQQKQTGTNDAASTGPAKKAAAPTSASSDARVHVVSLEERKQHHKERRGRQKKHGISGAVTPPDSSMSTSSVNVAVTPVGTHGDGKREDPDTGSKTITSKKAKITSKSITSKKDTTHADMTLMQKNRVC